MNIGIIATPLTFIALILSVTAYYLYYRRNEESTLSLARMSFYTATVLILFQAALLMWGILTHHFEWNYVFSYSSRELSLYYLISTFWAGQEGTFLLWLILGQIYGLVIIKNRKEDEPLIMSFMLLVQAFIVLILIKRNPFTFVWDVNPGAFPYGMIPANGNGLNPLLQDPWMTIHPPILFSGYSSTMIIFAFAMTALVKRNYNKWIHSAYPYLIFVNLMLGTGIILGGYWAYTTLGWGGFWGWDPVENSSLIPWLTSLALLHGVIVQRKQNGLQKTNIFLALLTFVLVLYASLLTRSGILTDFSVHSFGASDLDQYLIGLVFLFTAISLAAYLFRVKDIRSEQARGGLVTRETFVIFGALSILILALLTFIGTSSPIITSIFGNASNVSTSYYNTIAGPLAIIIGLLIGMAPILRWRQESGDRLKAVLIHGIFALIIGGFAYALGARKAVSLMIIMVSSFAILVNSQIIVKKLIRKNYKFGGYLTHVGIGLMMIGIVISSVYDYSKKVTLPMDTPMNVLGYKLNYEGKIPAANGKDRVKIRVNSKTMFAKFYWSEYSRAYMVGPAVKNTVLHDLYISPIQIIPAEKNRRTGQQVVLKKNEQKAFENYILEFDGYEMNNHQMQAGDIHLATVLKVLDKKGNLLGTIKPALTMIGNKKSSISVPLPGTERAVSIERINVESGKITLRISKPVDKASPYYGKELLAAEVTIKPMINILWIGTILMIIGFLMTMYQRRTIRKA